jgi:hypothetical protein
METLIIEEAVLKTVNAFLDTDKTFSIFDITQQIRQDAENGVIEIPTLRVDNQPFEFDIPHSVVKDVFLAYVAQGVFNQGLVRKWNGQYFVYQGAVNVAANNAVLPSAPVSQPYTAPLSSSGSSKLPKDIVIIRIGMYLKNCKSRGSNPTVKQIQSAIKRGNEQVGWTCGELMPLVTFVASQI